MLSAEKHKIFIGSETDFTGIALEIFREQYRLNPVYRAFTDALGVLPDTVGSLDRIPFLPIRFFKSARVACGDFIPEAQFESSGTTGQIPSRHFVKDLSVYEESFMRGFGRVYGPVAGKCILALLPSYLERGNSSLVYMADQLIRSSGHPRSGFFLDDFEQLNQTLRELESAGQPTILLGVTYALLDFAGVYPRPLTHTIVMETGGMKGRRKEMIREEVHAVLQEAFSLPSIHSEYGMTELLSQAYSTGEGLFSCPPWMKVLLRDEEDPLTLLQQGRGVINIIDLANIHSCAFLATDDAGQLLPDGRFRVLGRIDGSDLRGCGLMYG